MHILRVNDSHLRWSQEPIYCTMERINHAGSRKPLCVYSRAVNDATPCSRLGRRIRARGEGKLLNWSHFSKIANLFRGPGLPERFPFLQPHCSLVLPNRDCFQNLYLIKPLLPHYLSLPLASSLPQPDLTRRGNMVDVIQ